MLCPLFVAVGIQPIHPFSEEGNRKKQKKTRENNALPLALGMLFGLDSLTLVSLSNGLAEQSMCVTVMFHLPSLIINELNIQKINTYCYSSGCHREECTYVPTLLKD